MRIALFLFGLLLVGCAKTPKDDESATDNANGTMFDGGVVDLGGPSADAALTPPDAGAAWTDAGPPQDAGQRDAAAAPDANMASTTPADAGADTGTPAAPDAGAELIVDAGPPPTADAGVPADLDAGGTMLVDAGSDTGVPDAGPYCPAGTYVGVFDGQIDALFGLFTADVSGTITITLALSSDGQLLQIQNGMLSGTDQVRGNTVTATINGSLDCASKTFQNITLSDGKYTGTDPFLGGPPMTAEFDGVATATYYDNPPSAQGRWQVVDATGLRGGSGTWTVRIAN